MPDILAQLGKPLCKRIQEQCQKAGIPDRYPAQRALLQQYQTVLKEQPADDALMEHHREAMRALLACWLEMGESIRTNLDGLLSAQAKFLAQYLQVLDGLVQPTEKRKSSH